MMIVPPVIFIDKNNKDIKIGDKLRTDYGCVNEVVWKDSGLYLKRNDRTWPLSEHYAQQMEVMETGS